MFSGNVSMSFKSSKSMEEVIKVVEEQLEVLGMPMVSSSGELRSMDLDSTASVILQVLKEEYPIVRGNFL